MLMIVKQALIYSTEYAEVTWDSEIVFKILWKVNIAKANICESTFPKHFKINRIWKGNYVSLQSTSKLLQYNDSIPLSPNSCCNKMTDLQTVFYFFICTHNKTEWQTHSGSNCKSKETKKQCPVCMLTLCAFPRTVSNKEKAKLLEVWFVLIGS